MQVEALTAVFNGALTNVQQRSGSGLWLRFHLATIKQKMAIKDHRKRNKIPSDMEVAPTHKLLSPVTPLTLLILLKCLHCFYCLHIGIHAYIHAYVVGALQKYNKWTWRLFLLQECIGWVGGWIIP